MGLERPVSPRKTPDIGRFRLIEIVAPIGVAFFCRPSISSASKARPSAKMTHQVLLFTRIGCHLCDEAEQLLRRHGLAPQKVDIDASPELRARYDTCVPVVIINGRERFRGRVNEVLLQRLLRHGS